MIITILYYIFLFGVPLAVAAALYGIRWKEGFWGNIVAVPAVVFSMLVAIGWWESLAVFLCDKFNSILFVADFISLWGLFLISLLIIGEVTRALSRVKVKFAPPIEAGGNACALTLLFALLMGFFYFSCDLAPIYWPNDDAPPMDDSAQIQCFRMITGGNLGSFTEPRQFDDTGSFRRRHHQRREALKAQRESNDNQSMFYEGDIPPRTN